MLTSTIRHRIFSTRLSFLYSLSLKRYDPQLKIHNALITKAAMPTCSIMENRRWYSNGNENYPLRKPLMGEPIRLWTILDAIRIPWNALVIQQKIDPKFNLADYIVTNKKCIEVVSEALALGNYSFLEDVIDPDFMPVLKEKIETLTTQERDFLKIDLRNILCHYISSIKLTNISNETTKVSIMSVLVNLPKGPNYRLLCASVYEFSMTHEDGIAGHWKISYFNVHSHGCLKL